MKTPLPDHRASEKAVFEIFRRPPAGPVVRLAAVGDVTTSGRIAGHFAAAADGPRWEVFRHFDSADLVFGNFECVVGQGAGERPFIGGASSLAGLRGAGFTVLNLANNHVLDRGVAGLDATIQAVEAANMTVIGAAPRATNASVPVRTDCGGLRIGWLGAARTLIAQPPVGPRIWELDEDEIVTAIRNVRSELDVVVVSLHSGYMLVEYPAPEIRAVALRLAAAGADLILMHHPHVLQGSEVTDQGRVICYSLGNFLFDWREGEIEVLLVEDLQRQGGVFSFELDRNGVASAVFRPTILDDECRVVWPPDHLAIEICSRVERLSRELAGDYVEKFNQQRAERNTALGFKTLLSLARSKRFAQLIRQLARLRPRHLAMVWRWVFVAGSEGKPT